MKSLANDEAAWAAAALHFVPPIIREDLLNNQDFTEKLGLEMTPVITLGHGLAFEESQLLSSIRTVLSDDTLVKLADTKDQAWHLTSQPCDDNNIPAVLFTSGQQRLALHGFAVLSEDRCARTGYLDAVSLELNLPLDLQEKWRNILVERPLDDAELNYFHNDLADSPSSVTQRISNELQTGKCSISSLVPNSPQYYERLVGSYDGSNTIQEYAAGAAQMLFSGVMARQPYEGVLQSLLLSSHQALTQYIDADQLNKADLEQAFKFLIHEGDPISRIGAIEIGLRLLAEKPELESYIVQLIQRVRDNRIKDSLNETELFSSLFILVDGELASRRLLADKPPFYRRLASLTHAALIHRLLITLDVDFQTFSKWATESRGQQYYVQTLTDMQAEPRWYPDLASPQQIQSEFFGRIIIAGFNHRSEFTGQALDNIIFGDEKDSISQLSEFPSQFIPGPLEGNLESQHTLPTELTAVIEKQLNHHELQTNSFIALVNSAMIFRLPSHHSELAAQTLRHSDHVLNKLKDKSELIATLNGLAGVAAVSRTPELAVEIRVLIRRYRIHTTYRLTIDEAIRITLISAASLENPQKWRQFVGECLTELAMGKLEKDEGKVFQGYLSALLHSDPELWITCAKADAALQAWCER